MTGIDQIEDVIYGYKDGMCLAMDVYTPRAQRVDVGVIVAISGGWSTDLSRRRDLLHDPEGWGVLPQCLLDAGYVVFAVAHSTQPRYTIEDLCHAPLASSGIMPSASALTRVGSASSAGRPADM